ncbi:MAG: hypothetical protein KZQ83_08995 [gamma proteobacterium symbiont of Taylorina sp.]|nr:hypothetical protein [gamma proteobacterium symbiont of Taylorina sp.]
MNLSLTNELRTFIISNSGDGTDYATPSEFIRSIVREKKEKLEAAALRTAVIEGYQDAIAGRSIYLLTVKHSRMNIEDRIKVLEPTLLQEAEIMHKRLK